MRHDKKVKDGQLRFVLPTRIGAVEMQNVSEDIVMEAIKSVSE